MAQSKKDTLLEHLHRLGLALGTTLDLTHEARTFVDSLMETLSPKLLALFIADNEKSYLRLWEARGFTLPTGVSVSMGLDLWRWLAEQGAILPSEDNPCRCAFAISIEKQVLGVLLVVLPDELAPSIVEVRSFLETATNYFAPILRNIQRYQRLERQLEVQLIQLQQSQQRYRQLVESVPNIFCVLNPSGEIVFVNRYVEQITGYTPEELLGENWWEIFYPGEEYAQVTRLFQNFERGDVKNYEMTLVTKSGEKRVISWNSVNVRNAQGQVVQIIGIGADVTERKQSEIALRESEEKYRILAENSLVGVYILQNDRMVYVNPVMLQLVGYTLEEINKMDYTEFIHPDDWEVANQLKQHLLEAAENSASKEIRVITKDGDIRWIQVMLVPITYRGEPAIMGTGIDVTERRQLEKQLLQAQKMEAIGVLAGGVAHDFNNILTGIQGYAQLAMAELQEDDPIAHDLEEIQRAAARAANLTRQLLLFSRRQPMKFVSLNLNNTIQDMLKMLTRLIGEDISIQTKLSPDLWNTRADAGNIEQVIMNLAVNARDAMPDGGKITIETKNVQVDTEYCQRYTYARPGKFICFSIEDNGIGMEPNVMERIFEPFFSTKAQGKGTGLGLSVVYGIVKSHDGWINVDSKPGQGSIFSIYLPATFMESIEHEEKEIPQEALRGKGERILLVEDDEAVQEFTARTLRRNNYIVFACRNAQEAVEIFHKEKGELALIIIDVVLPDEKGTKLVEQLIAENSCLQVLFISGYTDEKSNWQKIRGRGYSFLEKPYSVVELLRAVKQVLQ
ncbi:hypothetical protein B5M50_00880 [candidate division KSB1 bacterium 4484_219]|nr:MAG: hypothetical protein B5M50_00880 [candidate division KSB1 bacterium 4484_219]